MQAIYDLILNVFFESSSNSAFVIMCTFLHENIPTTKCVQINSPQQTIQYSNYLSYDNGLDSAYRTPFLPIISIFSVMWNSKAVGNHEVE